MGGWVGWHAKPQTKADMKPCERYVTALTGGTTALLMSPAHLREFFLPVFRSLVQGLSEKQRADACASALG